MAEFLTLDDVREICFVYTQQHLAFKEPLPDFDTRFAGKLESILHAPQQSLGGEIVYKTLAEQAAVLFYEITKQHPFMMGSKYKS